MSRSRKKRPITGYTTSASEKWWKRWWHRRFRKLESEAVKRGDEVMPHRHKVGDVWGAPKDGKVYWSRDSEHHEKAIRK